MTESVAQRLRWSTVEEERELSLPGTGGERITHPEFAGIEFVHVRAKSLLNHVPAAAGLPFEWTINVYRGCTHACTYCLAPETPVLLADGRARPIGSLRFGDPIVGTQGSGSDRRYVATEVLDVWRTRKRAYRVRFADGSQIVASGDHRFLADDGWRYVAHPPTLPAPSPPSLASLSSPAPPPSLPSLPPAADTVESRGSRLVPSLHASAGAGEGVESDDDPAVLSLHAPVPSTARGARLASGARLCGPARLRGDNVTPASDEPGTQRGDPRDTAPVGRPVRSLAELEVVEVEDLGTTIEMVDITTGTGDFVANGVVSHNCFARPTHEYLELDAGRDFESVIVVKINAVDRLRAELRAPKWQGAHIALGTNTDPYQRCEGRYRLTRGVIETLAEAGNSFSVLTKGTLVTRDLDIYAEAARRGVCRGVSMSIPTLDERVWRDTEPGTPHPRARMEAIAQLAEVGVPAGVMVAPIIPGMSDGREQLDAVVRAAIDAGASSITPIVLHLRPGVREVFEPSLAEVRPDLLERYQQLYRGSYAPDAERKRISRLVHDLVAAHGGPQRGPFRAPLGERPDPSESANPTSEQLSLL